VIIPILLILAFYLGGCISHALSYHRNLVDAKFYQEMKFSEQSRAFRFFWCWQVCLHALKWPVE
jgi:hypothetical protein